RDVVADEFLAVNDDPVALVHRAPDVHIRAADRPVHLPDLPWTELVAGAIDRRRGSGLRGDLRALFDDAAAHAGAVELPRQAGVVRVDIRFDQQVIGRVVLELEIDNWRVDRRVQARPLA